MSSPKLTILMTAINGEGHFNSIIGIAEQLRDRGHKVVFVTPSNWRNKLKPLGFYEEWLDTSLDLEENEGEKKLEVWNEIVSKMAPVFRMTPEEQIEKFMSVVWKEAMKQANENEPILKRIVEKIKPDIILADLLSHQPAVMDSGIPWILSMSINPLGISDKNVPPAWSGYPTGEENRKSWENYSKIFKDVHYDLYQEFKKWLVENGGPPDIQFSPILVKYSPYANIYMYPEELDYTRFRPNPPNFYRFDTFIRSDKEEFEIPETLRNKPGKLIYFSMGTIGCSEVGMMRRLIAILAKSPHRFIVSKGPLADQIDLAENMWGAPKVPQTKVIPLVDLVISHGGNNTVTETFYFGKPMIILPLFSDQPDNAQRIAETGLGIRFHAYDVGKQELLDGIEKLVFDETLAQKMRAIGKRIRASNSPRRAAELVENIALNNRQP